MKTKLAALAIFLLVAGCRSDRVRSDESPSSSARSFVAATGGVVTIQATVIDADSVIAAGFVAKDAEHAVVLRTESEQRLRELAKKGGAVSIVTRPKIRIQDGARGEISTVSKVDYIKDYGIDASMRPEAIHDFVEEGTWIDVRAANVDGGLVAIELKARESRVERPIEDKVVNVAQVGNVRVQIPELVTLRCADTFEMMPGQSALVRLGEFASSGQSPRTHLVLLHVEE